LSFIRDFSSWGREKGKINKKKEEKREKKNSPKRD